MMMCIICTLPVLYCILHSFFHPIATALMPSCSQLFSHALRTYNLQLLSVPACLPCCLPPCCALVTYIG